MAQTDQMKERDLQLVLPISLHQTYKPEQRGWLLSIRDFMTVIEDRQRYAPDMVVV